MGKGLVDFKQLATDFTTALVARDFTAAHAMTTRSFQAATSTAAMRDRFDDMVRSIEPIGASQVTETMEIWSTKQAGDVGWAYVAIDGHGWGEALTVIITREDGALRIRDVEWGRP